MRGGKGTCTQRMFHPSAHPHALIVPVGPIADAKHLDHAAAAGPARHRALAWPHQAQQGFDRAGINPNMIHHSIGKAR